MTAWLNRTLLLGPRVAVVSTEREFRKVLKALVVEDDDPYCEPHWHGCVHSYRTGSGELVCVVGLNLDALRAMTSIEAAGVLVHEAVHVWQRTRDVMGNDGRETEAYAIQNIASNLMLEYSRRLEWA